MFEKVNPSHPDKIADRIAGAIVDKAYEVEINPRIAVELLIGHGSCTIITEASPVVSEWLHDNRFWVDRTVERIAGCEVTTLLDVRPQDVILSHNQDGRVKCGDNGIFRGKPITNEQWLLTTIARAIYTHIPEDGKYIYDAGHDGKAFEEYKVPIRGKLIICQSHATKNDIMDILHNTKVHFPNGEWHVMDFVDENRLIINPLGEWTGGINVDTGAVNRKLGSDMGDSVTGGGLHGKDVSKADVSLNVFLHRRASDAVPCCANCAIGDIAVEVRDDGKTIFQYSEIVKYANDYIRRHIGGFEKFAEWGLIR